MSEEKKYEGAEITGMYNEYGSAYKDEVEDAVRDLTSEQYEAFCYDYNVDPNNANDMSDFIANLDQEEAEDIMTYIRNRKSKNYAKGGGITKKEQDKMFKEMTKDYRMKSEGTYKPTLSDKVRPIVATIHNELMDEECVDRQFCGPEGYPHTDIQQVLTKGVEKAIKQGSIEVDMNKYSKGGDISYKLPYEFSGGDGDYLIKRESHSDEGDKLYVYSINDVDDYSLSTEFDGVNDKDEQKVIKQIIKDYGGETYAKGGKITDSMVWNDMLDDGDIQMESISQDDGVYNIITYSNGKKYLVETNFDQDMLLTPSKTATEWQGDYDFAKGGEVKKKGNEMIIGGLAGFLLGMFFVK